MRVKAQWFRQFGDGRAETMAVWHGFLYVGTREDVRARTFGPNKVVNRLIRIAKPLPENPILSIHEDAVQKFGLFLTIVLSLINEQQREAVSKCNR